MAESKLPRLVPYEYVSPGFEGIYTGERTTSPTEETELITVRSADEDGNVIVRWPVFSWTFPGQEKDWDEEIRHINAMQTRLGPLDDDARQIRAHIGSLVPCDSGLPVAVDELLDAIGRGKLTEPSFRNGCWCPGMWWQLRTTQPHHIECMRTIHEVLIGFLAGRSADDAVADFPHFGAFIRRTYNWLGPRSQLSEVQQLMLGRMLLTVEYFTRLSGTVPTRITDRAVLEEGEVAVNDLFAEGGRGHRLDAEIADKAGLPQIFPRWDKRFREHLDGIEEPSKQELYRICSSIASGVYTLSDCHHNTFRFVEGWIHGIGAGKLRIPTRKEGTEKKRLGRLLFGYAVGLDKWLLGVPMQLLLMDLGHVDLGFDPKNEVVRVYAYLGEERTLLKQWLAACLWHNLAYAPIDRAHPAGLVRHQQLIDHAAELGVGVREWIDAALASGLSGAPAQA